MALRVELQLGFAGYADAAVPAGPDVQQSIPHEPTERPGSEPADLFHATESREHSDAAVEPHARAPVCFRLVRARFVRWGTDTPRAVLCRRYQQARRTAAQCSAAAATAI